MKSYEGFQRDWDAATTNFALTGEDRTPDYSVQYVEANARTGSRYVVVISRLAPDVVASIGANKVISVLQPVQAAYAVSADGPDDLCDGYLIEKFCRGLEHGGDQAALCLTIRAALRLMAEPLDPKEIRKLGPERWMVMGYDVIKTGRRTYQVWLDGALQTVEVDWANVRQFVDEQKALRLVGEGKS